MVERSARSGISTFRGDWGQLARMMQDSWAENKEPSLRYTEELLRSAFCYPGSSMELTRAVYAGDDVVAFVAGFPRSVSYCGRPVRLLLNSFLTASSHARRSGYGLMVWRELINGARAAGYDGTINFCVEGDEMNEMMPALARLCRLNSKAVYRIEYLSRFLRPSGTQVSADVSSAEVELFCELATGISDTVPFVRTWTYAEAQWQCRDRADAIAAILKDGEHHGMLTGYVVETGTPPVRVGVLDDLLWGNLEPAECKTLLRRFLDLAAARGCQSVSAPVLGYSSTEPLVAAGFRRSRRVLNTYLTLWNRLEPERLSSLYIDVF